MSQKSEIPKLTDIDEKKESKAKADSSGTRGGNTKAPRVRARRWCFTLNNYTEEEEEQVKNFLVTYAQYFLYGHEIGAKKGTKHLQGYFEGRNAIDFHVIKEKLSNKAHIEKAKGNRKHNTDYCSKGQDIVKSFSSFQEKLKYKILKKYKDIMWKDWQQEVIAIVQQEPDERKIHWFWEPDGNTGKSFLCKFLVAEFNAIICDGKKDNIFNQIKNAMDNEIEPKLVVLDIPRHNRNFVNFSVIEQIKNGCLYSGKYEGGVCLFENPHVICFSNSPPDEEELKMFSNDRWDIRQI